MSTRFGYSAVKKYVYMGLSSYSRAAMVGWDMLSVSYILTMET